VCELCSSVTRCLLSLCMQAPREAVRGFFIFMKLDSSCGVVVMAIGVHAVEAATTNVSLQNMVFLCVVSGPGVIVSVESGMDTALLFVPDTTDLIPPTKQVHNGHTSIYTYTTLTHTH